MSGDRLLARARSTVGRVRLMLRIEGACQRRVRAMRELVEQLAARVEQLGRELAQRSSAAPTKRPRKLRARHHAGKLRQHRARRRARSSWS